MTHHAATTRRIFIIIGRGYNTYVLHLLYYIPGFPILRPNVTSVGLEALRHHCAIYSITYFTHMESHVRVLFCGANRVLG